MTIFRCALLMLLSFGATQFLTAADAPPNIVMLISDDQTWTDYSFMGHPDIKTPHLDKLVARSAVFRRGYVPVALCRPSLATMITGLYPHQHGIIGNDPWKDSSKSPKQYNDECEQLISKLDKLDTAPELLAQKGYISHQSGKWWEGSFARGGFTHGMTRGFPERGGRHGDDGLDIGRKGMKAVTDFIHTAAAEKKPFFMWYAPFLPHTPHNPPAEILAKYTKEGRPEALAKYYAMCEWFDQTCGQLMDELEKEGVADNTVIFYVTDNGWIQRTPDMKLAAGWNSSFAPKSKQSPYDGGTRTPIMISWPGHIQPADRPELVSSIDLLPTMLAAAGIKASEKLPGVNLLPVVTNETELQRTEIFGESFAHDVADLDNVQETLLYRWVIQDKWKLLLTYDGKVNRYKSVHPRTDPRPQLFDLIADPLEEHNLAKDNPEVVARLAAKLDGWWKVTERKVVTTFE
ncbi:MAG: sulfatase [Fuerstiella sp.]